MSPSLRRGIAGFELFGGAFGVVVSVLGALRITGPTWPNPIMGLAAVGFFGAVAAAGVLLWRNDSTGCRLSILVQIAQVPVLTTSLLTYVAHTPAAVDLAFDSAWNIGLEAEIGAQLALVMGRDTSISRLGINVVALACLVILVRAERSLTRA